jgi:predicted amidophosphoribosyltransferase
VPPPQPAGFALCGRCQLLTTGSPETCFNCGRTALPMPARRDRCDVCSRPKARTEACRNPVCGWDDRNFGCIHSVFLRRGSIDRVLKRFKYDGVTGWRPILGRFVIGWLQATPAAVEYDLIVPNPTHINRQPIRHTEEILAAARAEDLLGMWPIDDPADPTVVKEYETTRSVPTGGTNWHLKKWAADELWDAVKVSHPERTEGKKVLLFDDITTTCHQLRVVAGLLLRDGRAATVDCLVMARSS